MRDSTTHFPIVLEKLRYLTLDASMSVIQLLACPTLKDMTITDQYFHFNIPHLRDFLSRCPRLHALHIQIYFGGCPDWFFKALLGELVDTTGASSDAFRVLESLEVISAIFPLTSFMELITTLWSVKGRRLKSVTLTRCSIKLSPDSKCSVASDPGISSTVRGAVKSFTDEGLFLEIS